MIRWTFAGLHLLALGIGMGALWARARALQAHARGGPLRPVFDADAWWVIALTLWLVTGLVRAILGLEKPGSYYLHNHLFWAKMAVAAALYTIEVWPMTVLIQWGIWVGAGKPFHTHAAQRLAVVSYVQVGLLLVLLFLATPMARGWGVS
jgi:putative membrane protein